jgi:hypothetical protein
MLSLRPLTFRSGDFSSAVGDYDRYAKIRAGLPNRP